MFSHRRFVPHLFAVYRFRSMYLSNKLWPGSKIYDCINMFSVLSRIYLINKMKTTQQHRHRYRHRVHLQFIFWLKELSISTFDDFTGGHWFGVRNRYIIPQVYNFMCNHYASLMQLKSIHVQCGAFKMLKNRRKIKWKHQSCEFFFSFLMLPFFRARSLCSMNYMLTRWMSRHASSIPTSMVRESCILQLKWYIDRY